LPEITIRLSSTDELRCRWSEILPLLKRATDRTHGGYEPIDVFLQGMAGQVGFWFIENGGKLDAIVVTELRQLPRKRSLVINFIAGYRLAEWWSPFVETMDEHARQRECRDVMAYARPGWVRFWKNRGIAAKVATEIIIRDLAPSGS
jgi:hypothetical protein